MKKKWRNANFVLLGLLIVLCGCQPSDSSGTSTHETENNDLANVAESQVEYLPAEVRSAPQWEFASRHSKSLGKTLSEIATETGYQLEYNWYGDYSEVLLLHDGGIDVQNLFFSGSMWEENSYCTGVFMGSEDMSFYGLPGTIKEMKALFGEPTGWNPENEILNAYYQYIFDDNIEVVLFCDSGGGELDKNVIIKIADAGNLIGEKGSKRNTVDVGLILDPNLRVRPEWREADFYQGFIGKTLEEIQVQCPDIEQRELRGEYFSPQTGIYFSLYEGKCVSLSVPINLVFAGLSQEPITRNELVNYWHVQHQWYQYEGNYYVYKFEDVEISVYSDVYGTIDKDWFVSFKLQ